MDDRDYVVTFTYAVSAPDAVSALEAAQEADPVGVEVRPA